MQKIMKILLNSCKKTSELIDKKAIVPLSLKEIIQLKIHKSMCSTCKAYNQQSKMIDKIISSWFGQGTVNAKVTFPEEKKAKIMAEISRL